MSNSESIKKNENIAVSVATEPGAVVKLAIEVFPQAVEAAYRKAIKNINKEVSLPGFRKGKAPEEFIVRHYASYIDKEWQEIVVNTAFQEAIQLIDIYPYKKESISNMQLKHLSKTEGAQFSIEFEAQPKVPEIRPEEIQLKSVERPSVDQKQIDQTLHEIQLRYAQWEEADRPIQEGDFVELDIEAVETGRKICQNQLLEAVEGKMGKWMRELLVDKKAGETVEGMSEKEEEKCEACEEEKEGGEAKHEHKHAEFVPTLCRIFIHKVKTAALPDIDDELAKKTGLQTKDELLARVRADLEKQADEYVQDQLRKQVEERLLALYPFEIPHSLGKKDKRQYLQQMLEQKKGEEEGFDQKEAEEKVSKIVEDSYRLYFLEQKVAQDQQIEVSDEEIMKEFFHQMMLESYNQSIIHSSMEPQQIRERLHSLLLSRKVKNYLVEKAQKA